MIDVVREAEYIILMMSLTDEISVVPSDQAMIDNLLSLPKSPHDDGCDAMALAIYR